MTQSSKTVPKHPATLVWAAASFAAIGCSINTSGLPNVRGVDSARDANVEETVGAAGTLLDGLGSAAWDLGSAVGSGGRVGTGGTTGFGGVIGLGGTGGAGGSLGAGGRVGTGGALGAGGSIGLGGGVGTGGVLGSGGAVGTGGTLGTVLVKLIGTVFGTGPPFNNNRAFAFDKAFDGDINTWVDDQTTSNGYAGIDLGAPASIGIIRFYPRLKWNTRMLGGKFQCSTTSQTTGYADLYTVASEPPLAWTEVTLATSATCRYLRYLGPTNGNTNVAEVEFWGSAPGSGPGPTDAGAPLTNLSFNKPVMASSQIVNFQEAVRANDGNLTWSFCPAADTFPFWWMVDLGAVYPLVQADVNTPNGSSAYQYTIATSSDGSSWSTVVDQTTSTNRVGATITDGLNTQGRYVLFTITGIVGATAPGCIPEILVWGYDTPIGGGKPLTNLSLGKPATASNANDPGKLPSNGNDGVMATPYCPNDNAFPVWWVVDLGAVHSISKTDVAFEQPTLVYKYKVDVSTDNATWTTRVDQSNNTTQYSPSHTDTFSAKARYVRITILAISGAAWGCFWEFTVWGN